MTGDSFEGRNPSALKRRNFKGGLLVCFLGFLCATPQLASDMYMPALPEIASHFGTTQALASSTMTSFFFFMAIGMLLFGPISDKYGRKPVLIACSIASAAAPSVAFLIAVRAVQGIGSGGMVSIATAMIKDCFSGRRMANAISVTQAIAMVAPVISPLLGAAVFRLGGWRGEFVILAVLLGVALLGAFLIDETLPPEERLQGKVLATFGGFSPYIRDRWFVGFLVIAGLFAAPFMTYLGVASFVYVDFFGLSEEMFSALFAVTAIASAVAPLVYMRTAHFRVTRAMGAAYLVAFASLAVLVLGGSSHPSVFMAGVAPFTFIATYCRPLITNALLERVKDNIGAASSLINFAITAIGCVGMMASSLDWGGYVASMVAILAISMIASLAVWLTVVAKGCSAA